MKKIIIGLFIFCMMAGSVFAANIVNANNKTCPVLGGAVSGKDFIIYKGVKYGFCCSGCVQTFKENPEKYIALMK